jgi:hypothetical protein
MIIRGTVAAAMMWLIACPATSAFSDAIPALNLAQAQGARQFRADGTHTCQSKESIGHTCQSWGTQFNSCDEAAVKLKADDCCPRTKEKGSSIKFTMGKCTPL